MNHQSCFGLFCIGANEGMAKEVTVRVGTNIAHPTLRHPNGVQMKKVDEYLLHQLAEMVMEGLKRLSPIEIRKQIMAITAFAFD